VSAPDQHRGLSPERWAAFSFDQQVLSIGNEMNRALRMAELGERERLRLAYERVLQLTDLTVGLAETRARRRELLRWRDLVAEMYVAPEPAPADHRLAFRALLQMTPVAAQQIEPLLGRFQGR
jgi:hypothetical protein